MWPRLGKITALVSFLATLIAFVYQLQQYRKECPELPLLTCLNQVLLPDPAKEPLPSAAKTEWERAVRNTESEDRIEDFINKYKEGPYVKLAQERLKVSRVWRSIKTTDPRALFEFLSNYHDPIFAKLAKDALKTLDDQAWQLAVSVSSREAATRYVNEWSALGGRHLQDAQAKLNEFDDDDAWRVASREDSPEAYRQYLNHPWTRHAVQAQKRLDELAATKWEREVKNTDSEEVLESFINKYKVGSYVELAQERVQVSQAWRRIKNTTDPHDLFAFLSKYHDPIFEKLAQNSLPILDDRDWELALKKRTRDAVATYVETWSAFRGRHLQDAQSKLNELDDDDAWKAASQEDTTGAYRRYLANASWTRHVAQARQRLDELNQAAQRAYWYLYDNDPEAHCPTTSTMYSTTQGNVVKFYYEMPSKCLDGLPVNKGTLKFEGTKIGRQYKGEAYVFTKYCGGKSIAYAMSGSENDDHSRITLRGPAPVIEKETCRVHHLTWDSKNSTLEFEARELKAKAKPINEPYEIRR